MLSVGRGLSHYLASSLMPLIFHLRSLKAPRQPPAKERPCSLTATKLWTTHLLASTLRPGLMIPSMAGRNQPTPIGVNAFFCHLRHGQDTLASVPGHHAFPGTGFQAPHLSEALKIRTRDRTAVTAGFSVAINTFTFHMHVHSCHLRSSTLIFGKKYYKKKKKTNHKLPGN